MEIKISSINELKKLAQQLLEKGYKKFLLNGDLGTGKTEFTRQLASLLGIKNISSPTYTYINIYDNKLLHGDFYRINSEEEFLNLGILDEIENYPFVCIEWPKFEQYYADKNWLKIEIKKHNNERFINIKPFIQ